MRESGTTNGWFTIGIGLIIVGAAIYGILILFGIGFAINQASDEAGAPLWGVLLIPGLVGLGFQKGLMAGVSIEGTKVTKVASR